MRHSLKATEFVLFSFCHRNVFTETLPNNGRGITASPIQEISDEPRQHSDFSPMFTVLATVLHDLVVLGAFRQPTRRTIQELSRGIRQTPKDTSYWPPATEWFLVLLIFGTEDGGDSFLRNVG
jgi:hypothetical protein